MRRVPVTVAIAVALLATALPGCGGGEPASASAQTLARRDATAFLDRFVAADGRVIRRDQGGDTVSEGQAYALLLAVAAGDEGRFDRVWRWTRKHLQRRDGLLSWHWAGGRVTDRQPAADADLDAAHALALGARRFRRPRLAKAARRIGRAVRRNETVAAPGGRVVAAGPWARPGGVVNPSYVAPRALGALASLGDAAEWRRLAAGGRRVIDTLSGARRLPPDWARVRGGRVSATGPPDGDGPAVYGWDAVRVPIRMAAACDRPSRRLAAALWPRLRRHAEILPRALDGTKRPDGTRSSSGLAGAAAAAAAAGRRDTARRLLDRAAAMERSYRTYYGSALVALTRASTMTTLLGRCPR